MRNLEETDLEHNNTYILKKYLRGELQYDVFVQYNLDESFTILHEFDVHPSIGLGKWLGPMKNMDSEDIQYKIKHITRKENPEYFL